MKKTTKKLIFITLILMLSICFSTKVEADSCSEHTYKNCPDTAGSEECFKNPYANSNKGACQKKILCESYNVNSSPSYGSYMYVVTPGSSVGSGGGCEAQGNCYIGRKIIGRTVYVICKSKATTTKKCKDITSPAECAATAGCTLWKTGCTDEKNVKKELQKEIEYLKQDKEKFKCSDVKHLTSIWMFLRILTPFLVVLFGTLDFFKAMAAGDEKKMKESRGKFIKRLIAFFLFILLPFAIQFIFERIGTNGSQNLCLIKCITTNNTSSKGCD